MSLYSVVECARIFLSTPVTPIVHTWDNVAGEYISNSFGNGLFYAFVTLSVTYSVYVRCVTINSINDHKTTLIGFKTPDLQAISTTLKHVGKKVATLSSVTVYRNTIVSSWHTLLFGVIASGHLYFYVNSVLFTSIKVVSEPQLVLIATTIAFHVHSASVKLLEPSGKKMRAGLVSSGTAILCLLLYAVRNIHLLFMANFIIHAVNFVLEFDTLRTLYDRPITYRKKITVVTKQKPWTRSQLQVLYQTLRGYMLIKRKAKKIKEALAKSKLTDESNVVPSEASRE